MSTARDRLLDAAERCFEGHGITATGINELVDEAGVARMTLYNHFDSKADLVVAYLQRLDENWNTRVHARLNRVDTPRDRLVAVIREYGGRVAVDGFRGCGFINAAAELPDDHPGWKVIRQQKDSVRSLLRSLAEEAGIPTAATLATELFLLAEGAIVTAGIERSPVPFDDAEQAALNLIEAHLGRV